jgi:hypothetical protein
VKLFIIFDGELLGSIRLVATYVAIRFPWLVHTSPFLCLDALHMLN